MKSILFILLLIPFGCSSLIDEPQISIDPIAKPAYDNFLRVALSHGYDFRNYNLIIEVDNTPSGKNGLSFYDDPIPKIVLSKSYVDGLKDQLTWAYPDPNIPYYLEVIIFHELGHTFLLRGHRDNKAISIMTCCEEQMWDYTNINTQQQLQDELFDSSYFNTIEDSSY